MIRTEQALAENEANRPARTFRGSLGPLPHHRHRGQENYPGPATRNANARLGAPRCIPLNPASAKVAVMPDAPPSDPPKKNARNSYMNINPSSSIKKVIMESILRGRVAGAARSSARRVRPPSKPADILHYFIVLVIRLQLSPWTYMASFY